MYGTVSVPFLAGLEGSGTGTPGSGIKSGVMMLTTKFIVQLRPVAILTALSYIVSAMYSHTIGPAEHSNAHMKTITEISIGTFHSNMPKTPTSAKSTVMIAFPTNINVLRPNLKLSARPRSVEAKLTPPIINVIISGSSPCYCLNKVFE